MQRDQDKRRRDRHAKRNHDHRQYGRNQLRLCRGRHKQIRYGYGGLHILMRRLIPILTLLCFALPAQASITVVNAKQNCTSSPCTVTSTTAGHFFVIHTDSSTQPTAANVKLGTQTGTKIGCELRSTAVSFICSWVITSVTGSQTSV